MPLQETSGNVTADAYGGGVAAVPNYIEDVFSTYLVTSPQRVINGLNFSGKGGLVWGKPRNSGGSYTLVDTARGGSNFLQSNSTSEQINEPTIVPTFYSDGFDTGAYVGSGNSLVYWGFRKAPKFFDVVTYTGNGSNKTISHNLGSAPGCIIVKRTDSTGNWFIYHNSLAVTSGRPGFVYLDSTSAVQTGDPTVWPSVPTSTTFEVGSYAGLNASGGTYVAYLFAHNAGGFGLTGTDNVISCGSFTTDGSGNATVNLGYEPQWILIKAANAVSNWVLLDTMRGWPVQTGGSTKNLLYANASDAELASGGIGSYSPTATGFTFDTGAASRTNIYIAIRRGPMKVPTDATKVFAPVAITSSGTTIVTTGFPVDLTLEALRSTASSKPVVDRLRGGGPFMLSDLTNAESDQNPYGAAFDNNTAVIWKYTTGGYPMVLQNFRRAPSFFDEVCYTGTGSASQAITHNLTVQPQLIITKSRSAASNWYSLVTSLSQYVNVASTAAATSGALENIYGNGTVYVAPTSSQYTVGTIFNASGTTYVSYLFATAAGVSKVFSFTGNGTTQTINCGFTGGARFVLLKASSATGGWYVYDTARGMTTLNDPYLQLNSTSAETATLGSVTTVSTGFAVNEAITTGVNTNGVTYIGLAIA